MIADDAALVRRIEGAAALDAAAVATAMARSAGGRGAASLPWAGGQLVSLGAGGYVNRALGVALEGPVTQADLDVARAFFDERDLPLQVEVTPHADPSLLRSLGPVTVEWFRSVFAREVESADQDLGDDTVSAEDVDDALLGRWLAVHRTSASVTGEAADISDSYATAAHAIAGAHDLLATTNGQIAGAASMIVREGRALFGGAVTLPDHRRQGIQGALIRIRLARAARQGCNLAVADAEPGSSSARNLQRHGFRVLYTLVCVTSEVSPRRRAR